MQIEETRIQVPVEAGMMAGLKWGPVTKPDDRVGLVFLHANGFCASTYRILLGGLAQRAGRSIIALDLRGHGRSQLPCDPNKQDNWNAHARDIAQALKVIAPGGTVIAGHSMGATSALLASAIVPKLVKGMCLIDPVFGPSFFYFYAKMPWVFDNWRKNFPMAKAAGKRRAQFASREEAVAMYEGRGAFKTWPKQSIIDYCEDGFADLPDGGVTLSCAPAFEAACFAGQKHNPHAALRKINWPARLLRGERNSTTLALLIPKLSRAGFQVDTLPDTSHFLPLEQPEACQTALTDIMSRAQAHSSRASV